MSQPGQLLRARAETIDHEVRTLKEALRVVLGGGGAPSVDSKERLRATEWLQSFRRRDDAWDACVAVLRAPRGPGANQVAPEDQVFASQALLYKCRRRRAAITSEDVGCLLRLALVFTGRGLRPVLTQLCLGICACAVRHSEWEASKVLPEMVHYCRTASGDAGPADPAPRILMLELLTVLPDEATARSGIGARPERREEFLRTLRDGGRGEAGGGRLALDVLSQLVEPGALPSEGALSAVLKCALGWVQLKAVKSSDMLASRLVALAFEALESIEACDEACELLTSTMEAFTEPEAVEEMLPRVLSRRHALATASSEETLRCLATVFAAAACAYLPYILRPDLASQWEILLQIMESILEHPPLEIAALALEFWGSLGELLTETSAGGRGPRSAQLEESLRRACMVAMLRARYPSASEGGVAAMEADAGEELQDFREQVEDLLQTLILPPPAPSERDKAAPGNAGGGGASSRFLPSSSLASGSGGSLDASSMSDSSLDAEGLRSRRNSYPSARAPASTPVIVTPDGSRSSAIGSSKGTEGGVTKRRSVSFAIGPGARGEGGQTRGGWEGAEFSAEFSAIEKGVFLSPVQADLLTWLEGIAAASTREALYNHQHREQHQQLSASAHNGTFASGEFVGQQAGTAVASVSGFRQEHGREGGCRTPAAGTGTAAAAAAADWPRVEVLLRMLSVVARALTLRDFPSVGGIAINGFWGVSGITNGGYGEGVAGRFPVVVPREAGTSAPGEGVGVAMETLVETLPALPITRELQRSAAVLIGASAEWLARRPRALEPALQTVLGALRLEEEGRGNGEASMRDKGEDHVGAVALAKLVSSAGPSLAAIPSLPTHLLKRYLDFSAQLQRYRLRRSAEEAAAEAAASEAGTTVPRFPSVFQESPRMPGGEAENGGAAFGRGANASLGTTVDNPGAPTSSYYDPAPPLHAGSLRLFLGSVCRILGETSAIEAGTETAAHEASPGTGFGSQEPRRHSHDKAMTGTGENGCGARGKEAEKVLRTLVEWELWWLEQVLDRRRVPAASPASHVEENRAMMDVARESLSNLSLILRKTAPTLNASGLVAHICGLGLGGDGFDGEGAASGGGGRAGGVGVLFGVIGAFGPGEEDRVLPHVCRVFEAVVWATAERIRYILAENDSVSAVGSTPECNSILGGGTPQPSGRYHVNGSVHGHHYHYIRPDDGQLGGIRGSGARAGLQAAAAAAGGMRLSVCLGDALAEAFVRRPFVRFLDALRCITKELPTFGRCNFAELGNAVPNVSLRACEWVDGCLWAAATEKGGLGAGSFAPAAGEGRRVFTRGGDAARVGGELAADTHPEMVEALFKLMAEWIKELPGYSLSGLQGWLSVAISGLVVRHRGPARAVLGLLQVCCSQKDPIFAETFPKILRKTGLGVAVTRGLLSAMCGAMPSWMLDDLVATVRSLFDCLLPAGVASWVDSVLRDPTFERFGVSNDAKVSFSRKLKEDFCCKDWRAFKAGLKAFCGGKKKGTGGTPPVHASVARRSIPPPQLTAPPGSSLQNPQHQGQVYTGQVPQQQQQQAGYGVVGGERLFGSSSGMVSLGEFPGGDDPTSQAVLRSMTM